MDAAAGATQTHETNAVNVIGQGLAGLLSITDLLITTDDLGLDININWLVLENRDEFGASPSGGLHLLFHMPEPRAEEWAKTTALLWRRIAAHYPQLRPFIAAVPTIMTSNQDTVGVPGALLGEVEILDPAASGLGHFKSAIRIRDGIVIDTIGILPVWRDLLARDPRVNPLVLDPIAGLAEVGAYAGLFGATATVAAVGMGARAWGDLELEGILGWLIIAPPVPPIAGGQHTLMFDDPHGECSYIIPRRTYSVVGGTLAGAMDIFGDDGRDLSEYTAPRAGTEADHRLRQWVYEDAARGLDLAKRVWPHAQDAISDQKKLRIWFSLRPFRPRVINEKLDLRETYQQPVWMIGGLAGAGWTIGPAAVHDMVVSLLQEIFGPVSVSAPSAEGLPGFWSLDEPLPGAKS